MSSLSTEEGPTTTAEERAEAASIRVGAASSNEVTSSILSPDEFPPAKIDVGTFKYVLIEVTDPAVVNDSSTYLVRGDLMARYHKDAAYTTTSSLIAKGICYNILGGGRIMHDDINKKILVYGHSYGFPWSGEFRHDITVNVLKEAYPDYDSITWSNEGY